MTCGMWIRDSDGVAAFRCGDKSNSGLELCEKCLDGIQMLLKVEEDLDPTEAEAGLKNPQL